MTCSFSVRDWFKGHRTDDRGVIVRGMGVKSKAVAKKARRVRTPHKSFDLFIAVLSRDSDLRQLAIQFDDIFWRGFHRRAKFQSFRLCNVCYFPLVGADELDNRVETHLEKLLP